VFLVNLNLYVCFEPVTNASSLSRQISYTNNEYDSTVSSFASLNTSFNCNKPNPAIFCLSLGDNESKSYEGAKKKK
jgi:hypothetical protein